MTQSNTLGILNVGAGDTKLTFDKSNPAERIRAARIVTDMLRRGYALLIEVADGKGGVTHTRVRAFNEDTCEYIIADFDPTQAQEAIRAHEEEAPALRDDLQPAAASGTASQAPAAGPKRGRPAKTRAVPADGTRGVAVARSAGG